MFFRVHYDILFRKEGNHLLSSRDIVSVLPEIYSFLMLKKKLFFFAAFLYSIRLTFERCKKYAPAE
jgi:hypothetical protein